MVVSVIIPTFNRRYLLERAIASVQKQTYTCWELIVVDDGSTDGTRSFVQSFQDDRIRYLRNEVKQGAQCARNKGLQAARGKYIAFLDSDNEWYADKLDLQVQEMEKCALDIGVIYSYNDVLDLENSQYSEWTPTAEGYIYPALLEYFVLDFITPLIRKECFGSIGLLDEHVKAFQEWDTFLRIAKLYKFKLLKKKVALYYLHTPHSISNDYMKWAEGYSYIVRKYQKDIINICGEEMLSVHFRRITKYNSVAEKSLYS